MSTQARLVCTHRPTGERLHLVFDVSLALADLDSAAMIVAGAAMLLPAQLAQLVRKKAQPIAGHHVPTPLGLYRNTPGDFVFHVEANIAALNVPPPVFV